MVLAFSTSPAIISSSPPVRSPAVPIQRGFEGQRRVSGEDAARRTPSSSRGPTYSASSSGGRPPPGPSSVPKAQRICVGFQAPSQDAAAAPALLSPSKLQTRASLLSQQLLDAGSPDFSDILSPRNLYKDQPMVVLPVAPRVEDPASAALAAAQAQHAVFRSPLVLTAFDLAASAHEGQQRKNGESVMQHCVATAVILAELGLPEEIVAAGLLHDVLCDTRLTACQLEEYLPGSVVALVEKVTRLSEISQLYRDNTHSLEAEKLLDMLTTMSDVGALLIKLADRLHNMRTISALPRCKQVRMATETQEVFAVLANRLGAWSLKSELEDLAFRTLNPEEYEQIAAAIAAHAPGNGAQLGGHIEEVSQALRAAGLEVVDVSGRVKNVYGVWKKLQKEGGRLEEVHDVQALRVVVPHKHDCYAALRVVEGLWGAMPGRFKDYIRNRKANGYQSLHTTVRDASGRSLEVQIRTPKMHYIAEYGFAAHWRYKEKLDREDLWLDRLVQWKKWVAASKLCILDRKLRPSGSPGRDAALAELACALGLGSPSSSSEQQQQGVPTVAAVAAAHTRQASVVSPFANSARSSSSGGGGKDGPTAQELQQRARAAASAERFVERYGLRPVDDADLLQRDSTVLLNGPRGVRLVDVAAGSTLWEVFRSGVVSDAELRGCGVQLNGELVVGRDRWQRVLAAGDHIELVELGRSSREGWAPEEPPSTARTLSGGLGEEVGAAIGGGGGGLLVSGPRGESIDLERELRGSAFAPVPAAAVVG